MSRFNQPLGGNDMPRFAGPATMMRLPSQTTAEGLGACFVGVPMVLAIGTEFGETEMYPEPHPLGFGGRLIRIDIDPLQLTTAISSALPITADAKLACGEILSALEASGVPTKRNGRERAVALRNAVEQQLWPACRTHRKLIGVVMQALQDAVVAGDQTEPVYAINQFHQSPRPRSYFNSSTGYGTLGYGLPAAFGAKLGAPSRPSVCLIGDGGLQFSLPELASAAEAKIPVAVIVWNNGSYGEIKAFMAERHIPQIGVDIFTADLALLAAAMGCEFSRPQTIMELRDALIRSAERDIPTVIEIKARSTLADALAS